MSKIRQIISNNVFCVSEAEGDYNEVAMAMIEYAEWYAKKCIESLIGGICIIEQKKIKHINSDRTLKLTVDLPNYDE